MLAPKQMVKKIVSNNLWFALKERKNNLIFKYRERLGYSSRLNALHYGVFSDKFDREHKGVAYGKFVYDKSIKDQQANRFLLRRNVHRLEKGLLMRPRRDSFASKFIGETVQAYKETILQGGDPQGDTELKWFYDVLSEYFTVVSEEAQTKDIAAARKMFQDFTVSNFAREMIPYKRLLGDTPPVDYDAFLELSKLRRSVRWYLPKPVPRDLIDQAITAAAMSPSACNRQPFEFRVFDDPELVQKVASIPMGTRGFSENFPAVIVVVGKLRAYFHERDRHVIYIDASLASMALMYALESLGLSSCPINWPDQEPHESRMTAALDLEPDERVVMLISLGYPDPEGMVAYSHKKSLDQIRSYNSAHAN